MILPLNISNHISLLEIFFFLLVPGYTAKLNPIKGSPFIRFLCSELRRHAFTKDLLSLLTGVNRLVAIRFKSKNKKRWLNNNKITSYFASSLTRLLQFEPPRVNPEEIAPDVNNNKQSEEIAPQVIEQPENSNELKFHSNGIDPRVNEQTKDIALRVNEQTKDIAPREDKRPKKCGCTCELI
uniref:Caspase-7 n=1 Tax=Cacopsylla melanoneura TaxID=428564 RepID=A0A8D8VLU9_9HEMI